MGQKVNPVGFRLGMGQRHATQWYTNPSNYAWLLDQDYKIRQHIQKQFPDSRTESEANLDDAPRCCGTYDGAPHQRCLAV